MTTPEPLPISTLFDEDRIARLIEQGNPVSVDFLQMCLTEIRRLQQEPDKPPTQKTLTMEHFAYIKSSRLWKIKALIDFVHRHGQRAAAWEERYHEDVPALVTEVDRLKEINTDLRGALEAVMSDIDGSVKRGCLTFEPGEDANIERARAALARDTWEKVGTVCDEPNRH